MQKSMKTGIQKIKGGVRRFLNGLGRGKQCYVCGRTFDHFTRYRNGRGTGSEFIERLDVVGSDIRNFGCMYCGSHDRERHLFMFFDRLEIWNRMKNADILHFAPEANLRKKIGGLPPSTYILADLYPKTADVERIDATDVHFPDNSFDFVIANHVLEHIRDYSRALAGFFRILRPGGAAILQTPYSRLLRNNFEDENINTEALRMFFFREPDHVRIFGEARFLEGIEAAGFRLEIKRHADLFDGRTASRFGVNPREDLIQAVKPAVPKALKLPAAPLRGIELLYCKLLKTSGGESSICREETSYIRSLTPGQAPGNALAVRFNPPGRG
jgi:SAM-dependent methyltransferase